MKIVIFAPHPDDECYGAGGSILKWLEEGHEVHIIWFTDGRAGYRKARELCELEDCEETRINEEELAKIIGREQIVAGVIWISSSRTSPGVIQQKGPFPLQYHL